ncbi:hypothetical protein LOZ65_004593 [Ophidiomyces ophidiicola]|nr:hypothetical protein LOZ65_004593 [Ophidiomyces ophidiicola]
MAETQRLTIASTWKFGPEMALEIQSRLRESLNNTEQAFCNHDQENHVFTVGSCEVVETASALGQVISVVIDEEKDNDLLEKPRICRIITPSRLEDTRFDTDLDDDGESELVSIKGDISVSLHTRYWEPKGENVDWFLKSPYNVLTEVANATRAHIAVEAKSKKIRVSSIVLAHVECAIDRLHNLEQSASLETSPYIENILHAHEHDDLQLKLCTITSMNNSVDQKLISDHLPHEKGQLGGFYITVVDVPDVEDRKTLGANATPQPIPAKNEYSAAWIDYLFLELGHANNTLGIPSPKITTTSDSWKHSLSLEIEHPCLSLPNIIMQPNSLRFLSREKASLVGRWVTQGVEAGAVGPLSSEVSTRAPSPELPLPPPAIPGIKKRVAMTKDNTSHGHGESHETISRESMEAHLVNADVPNVQAPVYKAGRFTITPEKCSSQNESNSIFKNQDALLLCSTFEVPRNTNKPKILDMTDVSCSNTAGTASPPLSFDQTPSVPTCPPDQATVCIGGSQVDNAEVTNDATCFATQNLTTRIHDMGKRSFGFAETKKKSLAPIPIPYEKKTKSQWRSLRNEHDDISKDIKDKYMQNESIHQIEINSQGTCTQLADKNEQAQVSDRIKERLQARSEVDTRLFQKVMQQKSPNIRSKSDLKAYQKARKEAVIADAWGPSPPSVDVKPNRLANSTLNKWKTKHAAKMVAKEDKQIENICTALNPILTAVQCFQGIVSLEFQFGKVLIHNVPKSYNDRPIDVKSWEKLFRPQHGIRGPSTKFLEALTVSGKDVDRFLDVKNNTGDNLFSKDPFDRRVIYQFHCRTRGNQSIVVEVDETGTAVVKMPEALLGAVNVHSPQRAWDMRIAVKGAREYPTGIDKDVDSALNDLINNMYVYPQKSQLLLFTQITSVDTLHITKVILRRTTRHGFVKLGDSSLINDYDLFLKVTEVQDLLLGQMADEKSYIRARSLSPNEMMANSKLWYEISVTSLAIEDALESNRYLSPGLRTFKWRPSDFLYENTVAPEDSGPRPDTKNNIRPGLLAQMYCIVSAVLSKTEGMKTSTSDHYPCHLPTDSTVARPSLGASPIDDYIHMTIKTNNAQEIFNNLDSFSSRTTEEAENFW